jgi:hypothetical protein
MMQLHLLFGLLAGLVSGQATFSKSSLIFGHPHADEYKLVFQAKQSQQHRLIPTTVE